MSKFIELGESLVNVNEIMYIIPNEFTKNAFDIHLKNDATFVCNQIDYLKIKKLVTWL